MSEAPRGVSDPSARHRFVVACIVGGVLAVVGFVLVLHAGPGGFFRKEPFGSNFFDLQADAWLHGRWDVPRFQFFVEGFRLGSKTYTYFGPWPAFLRLPLLAVTGAPEGHLTALSMTTAFAIALTGIAMLQWRLRELFRPGRPLGRGECLLTGAVVFLGGCGTSLLFLASRAWVYPEAILWGAGLAMVAYERIIAFMMRPTRARIVGAGIAGGLAFLSRASVGTGPLVALGLILLGRLLRAVVAQRRTTDRTETSPDTARRGLLGRVDWLGGASDGRTWIVPLIVTLAVPLAVYVYVNHSRFGALVNIPWDHQVLTLINPRHRQTLEANGGTYFGLKFAPTTVLHYFRPDAIAFDPHFPWVTFPHFRPTVIGGVQFDTLDVSSSVVASMPAVFVLGVVGVVASIATGFGRTPEAAWLRVPLIGALAGVGPTIAISFIAERYLGDFVPLVVLAALIGIQVLFRRNEDAERHVAMRLAVVGLVVLAAFGVWANAGLAVVYARLYGPQHDSDRLGMLQLQRDLDVGGPYSLGRSATLPAHPSAGGTTWVVGDCDSMYWSDGTNWFPVEGTPGGGWFRLRVRGADLAPGWQPLVTDGARGGGVAVGIRPRPHGEADVGLGAVQNDGTVLWPTNPNVVAFGPGSHRIDVLLDEPLRYTWVTVDGTNAVLGRGAHARIPGGPFTVDPRVQRLPASAGLCRDLIGHPRRT